MVIYLAALFEYSSSLELAITDLEQRGIPRNLILAIPLKTKIEQMVILDRINSWDGSSSIDGAMVVGTMLGVLGSIYGFIWEWGPIIWGMIGFLGGGLLGLVLDYGLKWSKNRGINHAIKTGKHRGGVILLINCRDGEMDAVEKILWENLALGIGRFEG
ncbi:MAG: hypothetical protein ACM3PP_11970 [Candidatus Saccharibacteria bacterium]